MIRGPAAGVRTTAPIRAMHRRIGLRTRDRRAATAWIGVRLETAGRNQRSGRRRLPIVAEGSCGDHIGVTIRYRGDRRGPPPPGGTPPGRGEGPLRPEPPDRAPP